MQDVNIVYNILIVILIESKQVFNINYIDIIIVYSKTDKLIATTFISNIYLKY